MLFSKIIKKKFDAVLGRYEGDPAIPTPQMSEFPDLQRVPQDLPGDRNITLKGYFYTCGEMDPDKLLVFDHGISAGHEAYLHEIHMLAKLGWTVYSYDHTGCVHTGGEGILGFAQGVNDLDHVLTALGKDSRFAGKTVRLVGHSWGGYSAMNAAALHPEVTHVVSLAGFVSAQALEEQYLPKFVRKYSPEVMDRERQHNPQYADMNAVDSLKKSKAALLHLQSRDDKMVLYSLAAEPLMAGLQGREKTEFITVENRNHDPHRTDAAVARWNAMEETLKKERKKLTDDAAIAAFRKTQDWAAMNELDSAMWDRIQDFLTR